MHIFLFNIDDNSVIYSEIEGTVSSKIVSNDSDKWSKYLIDDMSEVTLGDDSFEVVYGGDIKSDEDARDKIYEYLHSFDGIDGDGLLIRNHRENVTRVHGTTPYLDNPIKLSEVYSEFAYVTAMAITEHGIKLVSFDCNKKEYKLFDNIDMFKFETSSKNILHLGQIEVNDVEEGEDYIQVSYVYIDMLLGEIFD